jgi:hypothetical protein
MSLRRRPSITPMTILTLSTRSGTTRANTNATSAGRGPSSASVVRSAATSLDSPAASPAFARSACHPVATTSTPSKGSISRAVPLGTSTTSPSWPTRLTTSDSCSSMRRVGLGGQSGSQTRTLVRQAKPIHVCFASGSGLMSCFASTARSPTRESGQLLGRRLLFPSLDWALCHDP